MMGLLFPDRRLRALSRPRVEDGCGWLQDRFGFSWQIVPVDMLRWKTGEDRAARDRAFHATLTMKRLDIAEMETAFRGE